MTAMRRAALAAISVLVAAASGASFGESYRGLYDWASHHGLHGAWAAIWPLQVDVFIAVGELALFVALADQWTTRSRAAAWTVTLLGLGVSVAGNVGHIDSPDWTSRLTAAVPPLAAAAALAVGLGVLKRVVAARTQGALEVHPVSAPQLNQSIHSSTRASRTRTRVPKRTRRSPVTGQDAEAEFMSELAAGSVPSQRQIRARLHVGQDRAKHLHNHLAAITRESVSS